MLVVRVQRPRVDAKGRENVDRSSEGSYRRQGADLGSSEHRFRPNKQTCTSGALVFMRVAHYKLRRTWRILIQGNFEMVGIVDITEAEEGFGFDVKVDWVGIEKDKSPCKTPTSGKELLRPLRWPRARRKSAVWYVQG